jgi:hypothetical protein
VSEPASCARKFLNIVYEGIKKRRLFTMAFFPVQNNMLSLLHYQHRLYTSELAASHRTLSKLYKKLERTERGLSDWKDRGLKRKDKKKLQWDRATTKTAVRDAEAHQALLHDYIHQCDDLIASYSPQHFFFQGVQGSWAAAAASPLSPTADAFALGSEVPATPWTAGPFEERAVWNREEPQYWDLSMLRERQPLSAGTPDSGFHGSVNEMTAGVNDSTSALDTGSPQATARSNRSSVSEKDELPELMAPSSPAKLGAEAPKSPSSHRRRYSENAIATIESRLAKASRVGSVPPACNRRSSETRVSKE